MLFRLAIICLVYSILPDQLLACRYTVRDIGFAALRSHEYAIVLSWTAGVDEPLNSLRAELADRLSQSLKAHLAGSNVTVMVDQRRSTERLKGSSAENAVPTPPVADGDENNQRIQIEFVDRLGRAIALTDRVESLLESDDIAAWLDQNVFISVMDQVSRETLESFAHLLIVEGSDEKANQAVHAVAEQAMAAIQRLEPLLPRPIAFPLRKIVVRADNRQHQPLLNWLLDNHDASSPLLAVVYGRGRMAGSVMKGSGLTLQEVLAQLALVGQSCECETDRAWLDESSLPFRWDSATRGRASSFLGFDPDSPLVRAEMLRIVSQSAKSLGKERGSSGENSPDSIARILLGYSETQLNDSKEPSDLAADIQANSQQAFSSNADQSDSLGKPAGVQSMLIAGEGWGFEPEAGEITEEEYPAVQAANKAVGSDTEAPMDGEYFAVKLPTVLVLTLATVIGVSLLVVASLIVRSK